MEDIAILTKQLNDLKNNIKEKKVNSTDDANVNKLIADNIKLKHRLAILNRVCIGVDLIEYSTRLTIIPELAQMVHFDLSM